MGYDVHVTRAGRWSESAQLPIPVESWAAACANDSSLSIPERTSSDKGAPRVVLWTGHPQGVEVSLRYEQGRIRASDPDVATLEKLVQLSRSLEARVVGDDGELYSRGPEGELVIDGVASEAYSQTAVRATTPGEDRGSLVSIALAVLALSAAVLWRLQP